LVEIINSRLKDRLIETQGQYQEANEALDKILNWKEMHISPPTTLPVYSIEERLRYQVLFDTWKPFLRNVQVTQKATTNAYMELWNISNDLMKEFEMQPIALHR
jgi:hypothetical protein